MTSYISVLRLDRAAIKALKITDLYSLHRVVYGLFEDVRSQEAKQSSESSGIQWVDKGGDHQYRQLLILSDRLPQQVNHGIIETKLIPPDFLLHQHYRFTITVSPTRRSNQSKKIFPIKGREAIAAWFIERATKNWGFSVDPIHLQVAAINVQQFQDKAQRLVTLQQATLSGNLSVIDQDSFHSSFSKGLGRGRSFGCGLLQIVPVSTFYYFNQKESA
ncbi:type I-E CRISPR-associated protein Cas6/Cse3/CasE (plasmid) [Arsenophonus sp. aPb]|uniref:type I-E CRISPR-associated protein Cas6/Cse3/CasE n=1 Tax=Arsenophonus sp. aPb TaxID=3041619 RepID=UPI00246847BB|nr:type I-E CRISPR-associated protein Cas6/Cse3/CasE [Arsenophonus sp. aPb]WGL99773.1 type I-E CRISPR-associated protein Cas6/Cse3/CasE [Arsenophonus sp. aPb]